MILQEGQDKPAPKLCHITEDGKFHIFYENFLNVLELVPDNVPIAVLAVVGKKRKGKSYLLNCFLRHKFTPHKPIWLETASQKFFESRSGSDPQTTGINIWPEPLLIDKNGTTIALILLDCQGQYDKDTGTTGDAVIFAITHILSSFLIYNVVNDICELDLQALSSVAEYVKEVKSGLATKFQYSNPRLMFLVRDFEWEEEYGLGYSDPDLTVPEMKNYYDHVFAKTRSMVDENLQVRLALLKTFNNLGVFTLADPGKAFLHYKNSVPDNDFQKGLTDIVKHVYENLATKRVGNKEITKNDFAELLECLNEHCINNKFPEAEGIVQVLQKYEEMRRKRLEDEERIRIQKEEEELNEIRDAKRKKLLMKALLVGGVTVGGAVIGTVAGAAVVATTALEGFAVSMGIGGVTGAAIFGAATAVREKGSSLWRKITRSHRPLEEDFEEFM